MRPSGPRVCRCNSMCVLETRGETGMGGGGRSRARDGGGRSRARDGVSIGAGVMMGMSSHRRGGVQE